MLSKSKSILATDKVEFLGFLISHGSIEVTPEKVDKIIGSLIPRNPREVREFNGLINYIGQFIPRLSHPISPHQEERSLSLGKVLK